MSTKTSTDQTSDKAADQTISTPKKKVAFQSPLSETRTLPTRKSRTTWKPLKVFKPYLGNPQNPLDVCVDTFLSSPVFETICVQAVQLATVLPSEPPPMQFKSFSATPMHHWYQTLLIEFLDCFIRRLRARNHFPLKTITTRTKDGYSIQMIENADAFNNEANAHINSILRSFNINFANRPIGSISLLTVDMYQPKSAIAAQALLEATSYASFPPKVDWKVGEPLAVEYRKRLRMFEAGVMRLLSEREDRKWILELPQHLNRGVAAYKEFYIAHLREEVLAFRRSTKYVRPGDDIFT